MKKMYLQDVEDFFLYKISQDVEKKWPLQASPCSDLLNGFGR